MKIKDTLQSIAFYFTSLRQVGHTTAMIRGAQNVDSVIVLARTSHHAALLQKRLPNAIVKSVGSINALRGMNKPLVIDNDAMLEICNAALAEIGRLERHVEELLKANARAMPPANENDNGK